jgi:divalent metal cation (Fe/Co/Zn/Cd) transporter
VERIRLKIQTRELERAALVRTAIRLERLTIAWMTIEAAIALGSGVAAHSVTLIAFGADSVIELLSAAVLLWRLGIELSQGTEFSERVERRASRIGGALLFSLAGYVVAAAAWRLWDRQGQDFSIVGLALAVASIPIMYGLARSKLGAADRLGSWALRADAMESIACGYLSAVVVIGLLAQLFVGVWWIDPVSALVLVPFLWREAREAWTGDDCCD